jgi:hypothetical protein
LAAGNVIAAPMKSMAVTRNEPKLVGRLLIHFGVEFFEFALFDIDAFLVSAA